jgi:hypothetical protein
MGHGNARLVETAGRAGHCFCGVWILDYLGAKPFQPHPEMSDETKTSINDMGNRAVNALMVWKLAIIELSIMCVTTAGTFYLAGTGDEEWSDMSAPARMRFKVGMTLSVLAVIKGFLSTTVSTLKKGGTLPPELTGSPDTQTWQRRETDVQTLQIKTPPSPPEINP